jgi:hypothetical protein
MNKGRVGEDRGSKEMDGCPLTQSFVDFINFYRRFIPGFSHHAHALFDLTMKDVRFIWGLPQEDSFLKLKELITSAPVLVLPNDDLPFRLEADGSGIATGMVLSQQQVNGNAWHPVAFLSKALNPVERNYKIHDTEMLAIIRGLEEWRHYLEGARHPVEIWTDHKNLEYFRVAQKLNCQQARWSLYCGSILHFTTSQAGAWVSQTHSPDVRITDPGKETTIT